MLFYFTDPVLKAPTIASMLMCMAASLVGVLVFIKRRSLLGESLSHAAYPGVVIGAFVSSAFFPADAEIFSLFILFGAFLFSLIGVACIQFLEKRIKVKSDAALCFVLASFFGVGVTLASRIQSLYPKAYKQIQIYLFGQAATMTDVHILIYASLLLFAAGVLLLFFKELKVLHFDPEYAHSIGLNVQWLQGLIFILMALAIVVGMRSVGVVLMSAMLIAPAAAARCWTDRLSTMLILALSFGLLSGFFGNVFSFEFSDFYSIYFSEKISFPTGPMIVMVAVFLAVFSLLFAPKKGVLMRFFRIYAFQMRSIEENVLKAIWRREEKSISLKELLRFDKQPKWMIKKALKNLLQKEFLKSFGKDYFELTDSGRKDAMRIVRLHRLWEVYLVSYLGVGKERVHKSAEEMEHILTPDIEKELLLLLGSPKEDPHKQPIPLEETHS